MGVKQDKKYLGSTTFRVETQGLVLAHELGGTLSKFYRKAKPPLICFHSTFLLDS